MYPTGDRIMPNDKEMQGDIASASTSDAAKPEAVTTKDAPLPLTTPKLVVASEAPRIDVASLIGPVKPDKPNNLLKASVAPAAEAETEVAAEPSRRRLPGYAPLAAGIALAAAIGAVAGAGTMLTLRNDSAATASAASDARALQNAVAQ